MSQTKDEQFARRWELFVYGYDYVYEKTKHQASRCGLVDEFGFKSKFKSAGGLELGGGAFILNCLRPTSDREPLGTTAPT